MSRICLYFREHEPDRWVPGDRLVRPYIRRLVRGIRMGGINKVFFNLCLGLDRLGIPYEKNLPFHKLRPDDHVGVLGRDRYSLEGYDRPNKIVGGIGMMTHPSEWPTLCQDYPIAKYLQHCEWVADLYRPWYGDVVDIWPAGIDTQDFVPTVTPTEKPYDFLIYDKIRWNHDTLDAELLQPILAELRKRGLSFNQIRYGQYREPDFKQALNSARAMIFLCEHETQGLACEEALAADVPVLAWDQGWCLDPNRFKWGAPEIPATTVPYFDERCGMRFKGLPEFPDKLEEFVERLKAGAFHSRDYILENLTVEKSSQFFVDILNRAA